MIRILPVALAGLLVGCTSVQVTPLDSFYNVAHVCIENNDKVIVDGFEETLADLFHDHAITTERYSGPRPRHCEYKLTYTALRSWDLAPYLSHAELGLFRSNERIAYAEYHLRGKGGLSLMKWASVRSKMTPVVNSLLEQYAVQ